MANLVRVGGSGKKYDGIDFLYGESSDWNITTTAQTQYGTTGITIDKGVSLVANCGKFGADDGIAEYTSINFIPKQGQYLKMVGTTYNLSGIYYVQIYLKTPETLITLFNQIGGPNVNISKDLSEYANMKCNIVMRLHTGWKKSNYETTSATFTKLTVDKLTS